MSEPVIECRDLYRSFRTRLWTQEKVVLNGLDLKVMPGECYTLLGSNGAGKSTLIKLLMNMIMRGDGYAAVQGTECHRLNHRNLQQIGFVSAEQELPLMLTVGGWLNQLAPLYPSWDRQFEKSLIELFDLDTSQRIRSLSRGMRMKVAVISAIAYRPPLLILDEPFSGLDALVKEELVASVLQIMESEQWTLFLASHDYDEIEKLTDRIGFLRDGRIQLNDSVDRLRSQYVRVRVSFKEAPHEQQALTLPEHWIDITSDRTEWSFVDSKFSNREKTEADVRNYLGSFDQLDLMPNSLKDTFVSIVRHSKTKTLIQS